MAVRTRVTESPSTAARVTTCGGTAGSLLAAKAATAWPRRASAAASCAATSSVLACSRGG